MPSAWTPPVTTSQARRGVLPVASTTSSVALTSSSPVTAALAALRASTAERAASRPTAAVVGTRSGAASVWLTPSQAPSAPWWTTRSPPSTRRPPKVRSRRTCVLPSSSTCTDAASKPCPATARAAPACWSSAAMAAAAGEAGSAACAGVEREAGRAAAPRAMAARAVIVIFTWGVLLERGESPEESPSARDRPEPCARLRSVHRTNLQVSVEVEHVLQADGQPRAVTDRPAGRSAPRG